MLRSLVLSAFSRHRGALAGLLAFAFLLLTACSTTSSSSTSAAGSPSASASPRVEVESIDPYGLSTAPWPGAGTPGAKTLLASMPRRVAGLARGPVVTIHGPDGRSYSIDYGGTPKQPDAYIVVHPLISGMGRVDGLFAYLAWLKDCSDPQGDPNVLVHAVLQIDDPTASDHQREVTHDALVAANKTRFAWFSCTAKGEVDAAWDGPRDVIAWVTPHAIYKLEAPKGDMATQLVRDLITATA